MLKHNHYMDMASAAICLGGYVILNKAKNLHKSRFFVEMTFCHDFLSAPHVLCLGGWFVILVIVEINDPYPTPTQPRNRDACNT
jgi:hypothetical protein